MGRKGLSPWVRRGGLFPRCSRGIFALVRRRGISLGGGEVLFMRDFPGWRRGIFSLGGGG